MPHPDPGGDDRGRPLSAPLPTSGRLAGVDYGTVRIGLAICDPERILVSPLDVRPVAGQKLDADYFRQLAQREKIAGFVVGLPIHCDGGESEKSIQARQFARWLVDATGLPVRLFDERFTTSAALGRMRDFPDTSGSGRPKRGGGSKQQRRRKVDAIAAQVLLESFLEAARYRGETPGIAPDAPASGDQPL